MLFKNYSDFYHNNKMTILRLLNDFTNFVYRKSFICKILSFISPTDLL